MLNDTLSNALSNIKNAERVGKGFCIVKPSSKLVKDVLVIMNKYGYIGDFKEVDNGKGKLLIVNLLGRINNCGGIKPRFSVKKDYYEKFEKRFLPAKDFGIIIVSTSKGIIAHKEAKKENIGGKLLSFVY
jgi:small subunit ribosomal protein S8